MKQKVIPTKLLNVFNMGEELNQQLFYAPIGSDNEPIQLNDDIDVDFQIPDISPLPKMFGIVDDEQEETGYVGNPLTIEFKNIILLPQNKKSNIARLLFSETKLPRKMKKRLKTRLSKELGIPTKELRVWTGWKNRHINVEFEFGDECV